LVDERIVGRKPKSLSFEEAAAMPLTTITAWEALYDRIDINECNPKATSIRLVIVFVNCKYVTIQSIKFELKFKFINNDI
jgi:hypothetical protein